MVRFGEEEDFEDIFQIRLQVHELHVNNRPDIYKMPEFPEEFNQILKEDAARSDYQLFVCENDFSIVGYALVRLVRSKGLCMKQDHTFLYIDEFGVDEKFRGQGYGKELMEGLFDYAKEQKADSVELAVWDFNEDAIRFYQSFGMTPKHHHLEVPIS